MLVEEEPVATLHPSVRAPVRVLQLVQEGLAVERDGLPSEANFIDNYCSLTGRMGIPDWTFFKVFQMFRLAAIVQGVYKRGLDGIASSDRAVTYGHLCRERAESAWKMVANG